ncbi:hypothetical protein PG990_012315 [Apiospora arundinis]|uniref:Uncharacterized protein n=1 Tax=Apiospora arundinis TaxID=335852 RepID=A0ABR2HR99_9PEZI
MRSVRRVTLFTDVNIVYKLCYHIDTSATPVQRKTVLMLQPGEPEPEWTHRLETEPQTAGACPRCVEKLLQSRKQLEHEKKENWSHWLDEECDKAFDAFFTVEKELLAQFIENCKKAVLQDLNSYHTEPLASYRRKVHHMILFGKEMQREVSTHRNPNSEVVDAAILVLGGEFIYKDIWKDKTSSKLRDGLEKAVPAIMTQVLAMRPNKDLDEDIRATMAVEFMKAGITWV